MSTRQAQDENKLFLDLEPGMSLDSANSCLHRLVKDGKVSFNENTPYYTIHTIQDGKTVDHYFEIELHFGPRNSLSCVNLLLRDGIGFRLDDCHESHSKEVVDNRFIEMQKLYFSKYGVGQKSMGLTADSIFRIENTCEWILDNKKIRILEDSYPLECDTISQVRKPLFDDGQATRYIASRKYLLTIQYLRTEPVEVDSVGIKHSLNDI